MKFADSQNGQGNDYLPVGLKNPAILQKLDNRDFKLLKKILVMLTYRLEDIF